MALKRRQASPLWNRVALACTAIASIMLWLPSCVPGPQRAGDTVTLPVGTGTALPGAGYRGRPEGRFLDVLTFNTALLPELVSSTLPSVRVSWMAPMLKGYDALVLQEAFVDGWRERLLTELADAYPYRGEVVGTRGARGFPLRQNGGIVILSRWPIVRQANLTFGGTCSGTDCLADKGVAYVAIRKGERTYHVFGTHAQSVYGWNVEGVRKAQFELFTEFVAAQGIPPEETVLFAGDFNVDAFSPELDSMLRTLRASWPPVVGDVRVTWDPEANEWADGEAEWLDYVLIADDYAPPRAAWNRALPLLAGGRDLSDHYAVWARVALHPDP